MGLSMRKIINTRMRKMRWFKTCNRSLKFVVRVQRRPVNGAARKLQNIKIKRNRAVVVLSMGLTVVPNTPTKTIRVHKRVLSIQKRRVVMRMKRRRKEEKEETRLTRLTQGTTRTPNRALVTIHLGMVGIPVCRPHTKTEGWIVFG